MAKLIKVQIEAYDKCNYNLIVLTAFSQYITNLSEENVDTADYFVSFPLSQYSHTGLMY